jgi:hypothetical protein
LNVVLFRPDKSTKPATDKKAIKRESKKDLVEIDQDDNVDMKDAATTTAETETAIDPSTFV